MKLYFLRHAESTANLAREFSNTGLKHPLTEAGVEQARAAAHGLRGLPIGKIYTSPVLRAVQTAQILAERLAVPVEISQALREWSVGVYEGTTDPHGWELHRQVQEDWFVHGRLDSKMPGGESFSEIRQRFVPFIQGLVRDGSDPARDLLLVGHGGLFMAMLPVVFGNLDYAFARQYGFPYTATAIAEPRAGGLHCLSWCGVKLDGEDHAHD